MCDVKYKLCAELSTHAALRCEKSLYLDRAASLDLCNCLSNFANRNSSGFKFRLPLDAGFLLHRTMPKPEVH